MSDNELQTLLTRVTLVDSTARDTMMQLQLLTAPAHAALARTQEVVLDYMGRYRRAHDRFATALSKAGQPGEASLFLGLLGSVIIAVGVGAVGAAIVGVTKALSRASRAAMDAASELAEAGVGAVAGKAASDAGDMQGSGPDFRPAPDVDPRVTEMQSWQEVVGAWRSLAGLAQIGLDYSFVWRHVGDVAGDLRAYATGGQGLRDLRELIAELPKLELAVLQTVGPNQIATLSALIDDFAAKAEHPLLLRTEQQLESDLWIDWISRLSGYNFGQEESDRWPVWFSDQIHDALDDDAVEGQLEALKIKSPGWKDWNTTDEDTEPLFRQAIAERQRMRDIGQVAVSLTDMIGNAKYGEQGNAEIPPPAYKALVECTPDNLPHGRQIEVVNHGPEEIIKGDLVIVVDTAARGRLGGEYTSPRLVVRKATGSSTLPSWAMDWVHDVRATRFWYYW